MLRKRDIIPVLITILAFSFLGCYHTIYQDNRIAGDVARTSPKELPATPVLKHFNEKVWDHYYLWGLTPIVKPDLKDMIQPHLGKGQKAVNVRVRHEMTFLNGLCSLLTIGIYTPMTTTVEGDIIRVSP